MSSPNNLEINGNLSRHPLAELLVEILQARFHGSVRLSHHNSKTIIYVRQGEVVFAVSNQRQHRIFERLLRSAEISQKQLVEIPEFTNDMLLAGALREKELFSAAAIKSIFTRQIEGILRDVITWKEGVWSFSPLARIKDDINYKIDAYSLLVEYGRNLPKDAVVRRFKSFKESFGKKPSAPAQISLLPQEAFLLSRFDKSFLKIEDITALSHWSDMETLQKLYVLWLAGFLYRENWDRAFKEHQVSAIMSAKFELKNQIAAGEPASPAPTAQPKDEPKPAEIKQPAMTTQKPQLTLEKYLAQVETAETHYELLNISHRSDTGDIKQAYFNLAKRFHPDLFHKSTDTAIQARIQHAFTQIAHAYETLRDEEKRRSYDYRLRKLLAELEKLSPEERNKTKPEQKTLTAASEIFEHGFNLLMEEDYEQALPYILRAVHLAPDAARYHAYYGKLLAIDKNHRFKAEAELQTAIKLEPENPTFRIMLAEFFIQNNLPKRAEGELTRLLDNFPNNKEARALLDSLQNK
ncbi:MAG TPA: DnaJ domain-containing protein [Pyrinomonadaceae bacterium]|jgi:curved DNA-binding protein CbpA